MLTRRAFTVGGLALGAASLLPRAAFSFESGKWVLHARPMMGTIVEIAAWGEDETLTRKKIFDCFAFIDQKVKEITDWDPGGIAFDLREMRVLPKANCSKDFLELNRLGKEIEVLTQGKFSHLCYSLTSLWREALEAKSIPDKIDISHALKGVKKSNFEISDKKVAHFGPSAHDLGGIGKGFIADLAGEFLRSQKIRFARIACSGDLKFIGDTEWLVEIEHPREDGFIGTLKLHGDVAVSTSGDYQNTWLVNNKPYHHLIDPHTGLPGTECMQVTIVHPKAAIADALATAVFLMPPKIGLGIIKSIRNTGGLIVAGDGTRHKSASLLYSA